MLFPLLLSLAAHAAASDYCLPLAQVSDRVRYCEDNTEYVNAAGLCLEKLDREILASQKALAAEFTSRGAASLSAQDSKFVNHDGNLGDTSGSLRVIIADAELGRRNLVAYLEALMMPGNPTPELLARYRIEGYLQSFPCYFDQHEALVARIRAMDQRLADLRRTEATDLALLAKSRRDLSGLGLGSRAPSSPPPPTAAHGVGAGSGKHPGGTSASGGSTITGEIRDPRLR